MDKPKIKIILASIREERAGAKVADWLMDIVRQDSQADFELLDLRDYPLPMFSDAVPPSARQGPHPDPTARRWLEKIDDGDGFIVVTPEYNHGYPAALKNAYDYGYKEWNEKAIGFVGYGGAAGGSRSVEQQRLVAAELRMYSVRDQVLIPFIWSAFDDDGHLKNEDNHAKNARLVIDSVVSLAGKLKKSNLNH
ncbi:NAD(P)H-dependent oxidoreductase [Candidatus Falkowbacteria bacterium]|nr:NAD(P)H-dependent oxidoreductase [Candidatus Falkowbacteria bacterium]